MAAAMAAFTLNDTITKAVSAELNIGQIILVRGLFAMVLIASFATWAGALRAGKGGRQLAVRKRSRAVLR